MVMRYGSVCSGIEAATVAWDPLGWEPAFFSDVEAFPRGLLRHHYPDVPLHGRDIKPKEDFGDYCDQAGFQTIGAEEYGAIDLLVGGTPCQSFSVAGKRGGLGDGRGNLALEYIRLADRKRPRWVVWENVPGVFSSTQGEDFRCFLSGLVRWSVPIPDGGWSNGGIIAPGPVDGAYGVAWRVLDAQYFGVAQRRRRVFVVGYSGDWRPAAAVLFERHSLQGHPAPRREAGEVAPTVPARSTGGGGLGTDFDCDGGLRVTHTLRAEHDASEGGTGRGTPLVPAKWPADVACTMNAAFASKMGLEDQHALGGASMFVPAVAGALTAKGPEAMGAPEVDANHYFPVHMMATGQANAPVDKDVAPALTCNHDGPPIAFHEVAHALSASPSTGQSPNVASGQGDVVGQCISVHGTQDPDISIEAAHPLGRNTGQENAVALPINTQIATRGDKLGEGTGFGIGENGDPAFTLQSAHSHAVAVRTANTGANGHGVSEECAHTPDQAQGQAVAFAQNQRDEVRTMPVAGALAAEPGAKQQTYIAQGVTIHGTDKTARAASFTDVAGSLRTKPPGSVENSSTTAALQGMAVRRLTPRECERLQGFPDDYTAIPWRNKGPEDCPDGPRYKALGNSMAVPVMRWIGERIDLVQGILESEKAIEIVAGLNCMTTERADR